MTHKSIPAEKRYESGVTDSLIRLSVGIEDVQDLIADLQQAIELATKKHAANKQVFTA
jgi:cystathionine beta-lyase